MKSIIRRFSPSNYGIISTIVILAFTSISSIYCSPSCGLYGAPPCQYIPAPPGQTPSCARPGKTYCEHVDNYPTYLIKHLVHKWGYEAKNLIIDETWDDFAALGWRNTPVFYDPAFIFPQRHHYNDKHGDFSGYDYETPSSVSASASASAIQGDEKATYIVTKQQQQTTQPPTFLFYSSAAQRHRDGKIPYTTNGRKVTPNNPTFWLKRIVRDLSNPNGNHSILSSPPSSLPSLYTNASSSSPSYDSSATPTISSPLSRDVSLNMDLLEVMGVENSSLEIQKRSARIKRQSSGRSSLCQTTSQFVAPQAALNSKGNWMFVVNEASTAHQLVKAELCASNTCSNLCQLPNGYNSRCEQKFAQKRLVALQANGQNLYTDTFWFPSCCVCTISAN